RGFLAALERQIGNEADRLCLDAGAGDCLADRLGPPHLPLTLEAVAPSLWQKLEAVDSTAPGSAPIDPVCKRFALFFCITASSGTPQRPIQPLLVRADAWAASFAERLAALTAKTRARATALVASDRRSYGHSRDLL